MFGSKKNLVIKFFFGQKIVGSKNIWGQKILGEKIFGLKRFIG